MARDVKVVVSITSDLSGKPIEAGDDYQPTVFAIGDTRYEVDLTEAERDEFLAVLDRHAQAGRRVEVRARSTSGGSGGRRPKAETTAIREWAAANGYELPARGRIPSEVVTAYTKATTDGMLTTASVTAEEGEGWETPESERIVIPLEEPESENLLDDDPAALARAARAAGAARATAGKTRNPDGTIAGE